MCRDGDGLADRPAFALALGQPAVVGQGGEASKAAFDIERVRYRGRRTGVELDRRDSVERVRFGVGAIRVVSFFRGPRGHDLHDRPLSRPDDRKGRTECGRGGFGGKSSEPVAVERHQRDSRTDPTLRGTTRTDRHGHGRTAENPGVAMTTAATLPTVITTRKRKLLIMTTPSG